MSGGTARHAPLGLLQAADPKFKSFKAVHCEPLRGAPPRPRVLRQNLSDHFTVVTLDDPKPVREHLESLDIEARPAWKPMHLQPVFADCEMRGGAVAEEIFRRGLCLPSGSSMTDADVARVVDAVVESC